LKLRSGVLELAASLGELLSRLRQFFGQLGRHFGHSFCYLIPKHFALKLKLRLDDVQFVVEVTVRRLLWASDPLARLVDGRGPNSFTAIFFIPAHIVFLLHRFHRPRCFHPLALGPAIPRLWGSRIASHDVDDV
jgi:hypothetical protein